MSHSDGTVVEIPGGRGGRALAERLPAPLNTLVGLDHVVDALTELAAGHSPSSKFNDVVFDFLDTHRGGQ